MTQKEGLKKPKNPNSGTKRIWLPYDGPIWYDLWVDQFISMDLNKSSIHYLPKEPHKEKNNFEIIGHEQIDSYRDPGTNEIVYKKTPRTPGLGIYINKKMLGSLDFFRITECCNWIFCTDPVHDYILEKKYTNVDFLEMGEIY
jgi:hypothetical protein